MRFLYEPVLYMQATEMPQAKIEYIQSVYDIMERFLTETPYVCGDDLTIADFCLVATLASLTGKK